MPILNGSRRSARNMEAEGTLRTADNDVIPKSIAEDPTRLAIWRLVTGDMKERGIDSPTFFFMVMDTVETLAFLHEARELVKKEGQVLVNPRSGASYTNPAFANMTKLQGMYQKQAEKLGLDPRSITFLARINEASLVAQETALDSHIDTSVVYLR